MNIVEVTLLSLIQGLTEFLPVSSSGHLILFHHFFSPKGNHVLFDLALHFGTVLAIFFYFRKTLFSLIMLKKKSERFFVGNLIISNFFCFLIVFPLKDVASSSQFRSTHFVALNLIFWAFPLFLSDHLRSKWERKKGNLEKGVMWNKLQVKKSILFGLFQSLALFPGVSRSGILLTVGRTLGLSRAQSAEYAFIMGIPIILGGVVLKLPEYMTSFHELGPTYLKEIVLGVVLSFAFALMTINTFLKLLPKVGLWVYSLYRLFLGVLMFMIL